MLPSALTVPPSTRSQHQAVRFYLFICRTSGWLRLDVFVSTVVFREEASCFIDWFDSGISISGPQAVSCDFSIEFGLPDFGYGWTYPLQSKAQLRWHCFVSYRRFPELDANRFDWLVASSIG